MNPQANVPLPGLTLAMIARNEEGVIARSLESAKGIASDIIVVDTGSTDQTAQIATQFGARVLEKIWKNDFSDARNAALASARNAWILVLDADEYLPVESAAAIASLIRQHPAQDRAFHLIQKSLKKNGRSGICANIVRLFPNKPSIRYEWPIHEQVVTSLDRAGIPIFDTPIEILHTGYADPAANRAKQERNLQILEKFVAENSSPHPMALFLKGGALLDLGRIDEAKSVYAETMSRTESGNVIHEASRVRLAKCLFLSGDFSGVLRCIPPLPSDQWHPELLVLKGQSAESLGEMRASMAYFHEALAIDPRPMIPAYDPLQISIRAVMGIASHWKNSDPNRALNLVRLCSESMGKGTIISLDRVLSIEQG